MLPEPHAFKPNPAHPKQCATCGGWADASYHNLELFTGADHERQRVHDAEEAERMSRTLQTSKDVSHASAILENESPLFAGENWRKAVEKD